MGIKPITTVILSCLLLWGAFLLPTIEGEPLLKSSPDLINQQRKVDGKRWNARVMEHDNRELIVLVPETATAQELPIKIMQINRGNDEIFTLVNSYGDSYGIKCIIEIRDKDGKKLPYTKLGSDLFSFDTFLKPGKGMGLKPGQTDSWKINIAEYFEPLTPGKYTVSLETPFPKKEKNRVSVELPMQVQ